ELRARGISRRFSTRLKSRPRSRPGPHGRPPGTLRDSPAAPLRRPEMTRPSAVALGVLLLAGALARAELAGDVVARVNGRALSEAEFHAFVGREFHTDARAQKLLEHLVQQTVIRVEAERAGVAIDERELEERYRRLDDENVE